MLLSTSTTTSGSPSTASSSSWQNGKCMGSRSPLRLALLALSKPFTQIILEILHVHCTATESDKDPKASDP